MTYCPNCGTQYVELPVRCQCGYLFAARTVATPEPAGQPGMLDFVGEGVALLLLYVKLIGLSIVTLGIYSFWGRAEIRRYLFGNLRFAGQALGFHGTGKELFIGWLKLVGLFIGIYSVVGIYWLLKIGPEAIGALILVLAMGMLAPLAIHGAVRYRWSRTSWQGRRFSYTGDLMELTWIVLPGLLLSMVTLGLYLPYFATKLRHYITTHSSYGGHGFDFDGDPKDLLMPTVKMLLLLIPTLGIYRFYYHATLQNYFWNHTTFAGARFQSKMTGWDLLVLSVTNNLLTVFTLGIGYPWAVCRSLNYVCDTLQMSSLPRVDLSNLAIPGGSALGDTLGAEIGTDAGIDAGFGL